MTTDPHLTDSEHIRTVNEALRRETFERIRNDEALYRGRWIKRSRVGQTRLRQGAADLWHAIEYLLVLCAIAMVGVLFFLLIDAII